MKSTFSIKSSKNLVTFDCREFKDGAIQVVPVLENKDITLSESLVNFWGNGVFVEAHIKDTQGLIALGQIKNIVDSALKNTGENVGVKLVLGYMPFSRYDRAMYENDAFSLKLVIDMINSMKFDDVYVSDPHSNVTEILLNNIIIMPQEECIEYFRNDITSKYDGIVSPDAGALKKIEKVAKTLDFDFTQVINCGKVRDIQTGEIVRTDVYNDVQGKSLLLVDDICDGGRTFIQLAKVLKEKGAKQVDLYVTHGMFFYGFDELQKDITNIYCLYNWTDRECDDTFKYIRKF